MVAKMRKTTFGVRVYEYKAPDGTTYWSFSKSPQTISPPRKLVLQDKVGMTLLRFVNYLRKQAVLWLSGVEEDEEGSVE